MRQFYQSDRPVASRKKSTRSNQEDNRAHSRLQWNAAGEEADVGEGNRAGWASDHESELDADQINALRESLADNWSIAVFPEGTTTDGQSLLPFKTSMLRVLEPPPPGVLVQPVLLDYGAIAEWIGWVGDETGIANAKRILARRGSFDLAIHFLDPFDPRDFNGRKAIAAEARLRIEPALVSALGKPLRVFARSMKSKVSVFVTVSLLLTQPTPAFP
mgnify:CR=1 FL=1